jgi:hypothetical protein
MMGLVKRVIDKLLEMQDRFYYEVWPYMRQGKGNVGLLRVIGEGGDSLLLKCHSPETVFCMSDGRLVPAPLLSSSDSFLSYKDRPDKQAYFEHAIADRGEVRMTHAPSLIRIYTRMGFTEVIPEHIFFVRTREEWKRIKCKTAAELKIGDHIPVAAHFTGQNLPLPRYRSRREHELMELVGYIAGDGSIEEKRIRLFDENVRCLQYYGKLLSDFLNCDGSLCQQSNSEGFMYCVHSTDIVKFKSYIGEWNGLRYFNPSLFSRTRETIASLIRGFFDAEGGVGVGTGIYLHNTSPFLMKQIACALLRFGIFMRVVRRPNRNPSNPSIPTHIYEGLITDYASIWNFYKYIGFNHPEKRRKLNDFIKFFGSRKRHIRGRSRWGVSEDWENPSHYWSEVIGVEYGGNPYGYVISVTTTTHKLVADGFITHNCDGARIMYADGNESAKHIFTCSIDTFLSILSGEESLREAITKKHFAIENAETGEIDLVELEKWSRTFERLRYLLKKFGL